jgi:hypothetical protein
METNRAVSHVEFFAKACTAMLEVRENGRYRVNEPETITVCSLNGYYFGHWEKCNVFVAKGIGRLHFPGSEGVIAPRRGIVTCEAFFMG